VYIKLNVYVFIDYESDSTNISEQKVILRMTREFFFYVKNQIVEVSSVCIKCERRGSTKGPGLIHFIPITVWFQKRVSEGWLLFRPKEICVFTVTCQKNLGSVGQH
jgi:hypothetical protein